MELRTVLHDYTDFVSKNSNAFSEFGIVVVFIIISGTETSEYERSVREICSIIQHQNANRIHNIYIYISRKRVEETAQKLQYLILVKWVGDPQQNLKVQSKVHHNMWN